MNDAKGRPGIDWAEVIFYIIALILLAIPYLFFEKP